MDLDLKKDLRRAELVYVDDKIKGYSRKRSSPGFIYFDPGGKRIQDPETLDRIKKLAIPPAWDKVWICPKENGYLQVTGVDKKGRKQYIYHSDWTKISQENKFKKMVFFGEVLPHIRRKVSLDMNGQELSKEKILATVVWLLEHTFIRVGNDEYAKENNSFGLTTLRSRHVTVRGENVHFEFRGKSGIDHSITFAHPRVSKIIKECIELPGYEIFQYLDERGEKHDIDSSDVNAYLKMLSGDEITAKDFRTSGGTALGADTLHSLGFFETEKGARKNIVAAVKKVSEYLGNTPSVCRSYYIHPVVFDTYQERILIPHFDKVFLGKRKEDGLSKKEYALLTLLKEYA